MLSVHQIALDQNNKQRTFFANSAGTAQFSYNWALARWKEQYAAGHQPGEVSLRRELNSIKKEEYPSMLEVGKCAPQQATATVSLRANRWYVSVTVETSEIMNLPSKNQGAVGIDLGSHHLATLSSGKKFEAPKNHISETI